MNERIKQLALQAEKTVKSKYPNDPMNIGVARMMDVFGELLVRECINTIKQNENDSLTIGNFTDEKKQGIQLGLEFAITDIAEHFGVQE